MTGDVIREWWARETLGDCHVELVGVVWEATSCGLKSAAEDGWVTLDTGCWSILGFFFALPFCLVRLDLDEDVLLIGLPSLAI